MPVSGWVLTLAPDEFRRTDALRLLAADPRVTLGEPSGARLPFVLETSSPNEERALIEALSDGSVALFIDLVFLDFSDVDVYHGELPWRRGRSEPGDAAPLEVQS